MRGLDDLVRAGKVATSGSPTRRRGSPRRQTRWPRCAAGRPFVALQVEYSLIERTVERELLPVADAFGLSVTAWAPMGGGVLTGKYSRGSAGARRTRKRAAPEPAAPHRAEPEIAREVDRIADELGATSAQVAIAWVRSAASGSSRSSASATLDQLDDVLGSLEVELSAEHVSRLDQVSADRARVPVFPTPVAAWTTRVRRPRAPDRATADGALPLAAVVATVWNEPR